MSLSYLYLFLGLLAFVVFYCCWGIFGDFDNTNRHGDLLIRIFFTILTSYCILCVIIFFSHEIFQNYSLAVTFTGLSKFVYFVVYVVLIVLLAWHSHNRKIRRLLYIIVSILTSFSYAVMLAWLPIRSIVGSIMVFLFMLILFFVLGVSHSESPKDDENTAPTKKENKP